MMIRNETKPNDKVIIQSPVYYPFKAVIEGNGRLVSDNQLVLKGDKYLMDFEDLEEKAKDPDTSMMILCSPHNPVGRVWTREELERVADICLENDVLLVSDEIHFDLVYKGHKHISIAALGDKYAQKAVVCTAPSKTFNIAGLHTSYCIIRNPEYMQRYRNELGLLDLNRSNCFSREITQTVYEQGEAYVDQLVDFLESNMNYVHDFIRTHIPGIIAHKLEATYLMWLDCRPLNLTVDEIDTLFFDKAKIALDSGHWFGETGEGFMRINLACSRAMLEEGLNRLKAAVASLERM
jgi:cystathionine beta-lyase